MRLLVLLTLASCVAAPLAAAAPRDGAARAQALYERAQRRIARGSSEQRQMALQELGQAARLDPAQPAYPLAAGRLCLAADMLLQARHWCNRVLARDSGNADAHRLAGEVWRRDWLVTADEVSRDRAILCLSRSVRARPGASAPWLFLAPLLVEAGDLDEARFAAEMAWEADSSSADAWLCRAYTAHRAGAPAEAWFAAALARLPERVRERFLDVRPLLHPAAAAALDRATPSRLAGFAQEFWAVSDPDLVTPVNEARLEFLARAAHAYFLYFDRTAGTWDTRGDLLVRFGPPRWSARNPAFRPTYVDPSAGTWLVWGYPDLGLRVWMCATNPLGTYHLPQTVGGRIPIPFPDSLTRRPELLAVGSGWSVFPRLPPGAAPLALECALARFEGERNPRLLAQAECPGSPDEALQAEWVVLDSLGREVARQAGAMSPSACAPGEARAAGFSTELAPGRYRLGVAVHDGHGRRGVYTAIREVGPVGGRLALSDVVVTCGSPQTGFVAGQGLRLEPAPRARASRDQLTAYFEIYRLSPGADGASRFEYVYTVRPVERDPRSWIRRVVAPRRRPAPIVATREETTLGSLRRQFLTVPLRGLPDGRYELEVRVRDLLAGSEAVAEAEFSRGD